MKKFVALLLLLSLLALSLVSCGGTPPADTTTAPDANKVKYDTAVAYISEGKYAEAYALFEELGAYEDSEEYLGRFHYMISELTLVEEDQTMEVVAELGDNNLTKKLNVSYDGVAVGSLSFTYDDKGRITLELVTAMEGETQSTAYTYDENGNLISHMVTDSDGESGGYTYVYNAEGKLTQTNLVLPGGTTSVASVNTYDQNGNLIRVTKPTEYGEDQVINYTYDANGNVLKEEYITGYGYTYTNEYTYDAAGNVLTHKYSLDDEVLDITEYTYDAAGNLLTEKYTSVSDYSYPVGTVILTTYTYDAAGNLLKEERTYDGDLSFVIEYTYDAAGNMTGSVYLDGEDGEVEETVEIKYTLVYVEPALAEGDLTHANEYIMRMFAS